MGKRCLKTEATWLPSLERGKDDAVTVAKAAESLCMAVERPPLVYNRQAFPWQEVRHPLLREKQTGEDGSTTVTAPIRGKLAELLSHHIIFGEIVVPGATYLEMAIAAAEYHLGGRGQQLTVEIGFSNPLTFRLAEKDRPLRDLALKLQVAPDGGFAIASVD